MNNIPCRICLEEIEETDVSKYNFIKYIGKGSYGDVEEYLTNDGKIRVIKKYKARNFNYTDMVREISSLSVVKGHPDFISMLGVNISSNTSILILEKAIGSLKQFRNILSPKDIKNVMYRLIRGIRDLNKVGIYHRDIKPDNILIMEDGSTLIADLGLAKGGPFEALGMSSPVYTIWYRAPEVILKDLGLNESYGQEAEVWAIGMLFWDLLTANNKQAYYLLKTDVLDGSDRGLDQLYKVTNALNRENNTDSGWSQRVIKELKKMKKTSAWSGKKDIAFENYIGSFFDETTPQEGLDLVAKMLAIDPRMRIDLDSALEHDYFSDITDIPPVPSDLLMFNINDFPELPDCSLFNKSDSLSDDPRTIWTKLSEEIYEMSKPNILNFFLASHISRCLFARKKIDIKNFQLNAYACLLLVETYNSDISSFTKYMTKTEILENRMKEIFLIVGLNLHLPTSWQILTDKYNLEEQTAVIVNILILLECLFPENKVSFNVDLSVSMYNDPENNKEWIEKIMLASKYLTSKGLLKTVSILEDLWLSK